MPSGTTSLPMPSPAITATRYVFAIPPLTTAPYCRSSSRGAQSGTAAISSSGIKRLLRRRVPRSDDESLVHIPDVGVQHPLSADLLPDHGIFQGGILRRRALGLEGAGADLARTAAADRLHVGGAAFHIAELLHGRTPEFLDLGTAVRHRRTGRQHIGVLRIHRRNRGRVALVEGRAPLILQLLDRGLALCHRRH